MHEFSLVRGLIAQVLQAAHPCPASSVRVVRVSCGPLAGVEPLLVQSAFEQLKQAVGLGSCELCMEESPLRARCLDCAAEFAVLNFHFHCSHCQSTSIQVIQGDEFCLVSLQVLDQVT